MIWDYPPSLALYVCGHIDRHQAARPAPIRAVMYRLNLLCDWLPFLFPVAVMVAAG